MLLPAFLLSVNGWTDRLFSISSSGPQQYIYIALSGHDKDRNTIIPNNTAKTVLKVLLIF